MLKIARKTPPSEPEVKPLGFPNRWFVGVLNSASKVQLVDRMWEIERLSVTILLLSDPSLPPADRYLDIQLLSRVRSKQSHEGRSMDIQLIYLEKKNGTSHISHPVYNKQPFSQASLHKTWGPP